MAKQRFYELIYLVQPEVTDELRSAISDKLTGTLTTEGEGSVVKFESWGKRKLAYPIRKGITDFYKAYYEYVVYEANPSINHELERQLRLNENCIRFMTIKLDGYTPAAAPAAEEA